jgi:hypothetical protein
MLQLQAGGRRETPSVQLSRLQPRERRDPKKEDAKNTKKNTTGMVFSSKYTTPGLSFASSLRNNTEQQQQHQPHRVPMAAPVAVEKPSVPASLRQQEPGQPVQASNVSNVSLDNMFRIAAVVQQIMTDFSGAVSEEAKIVAITKIVLNLMKQNGH